VAPVKNIDSTDSDGARAHKSRDNKERTRQEFNPKKEENQLETNRETLRLRTLAGSVGGEGGQRASLNATRVAEEAKAALACLACEDALAAVRT
jgi:hypothetical protein